MEKFRIIENQYLDRIEFYPEYLSCVNVWKPIPYSSISNSYADAMIIIEQFKRMNIKPTISLVHYLNDVEQKELTLTDVIPTYDELVYALKCTHQLYVEAVKDKYQTHDITQIVSNDYIFKKLTKN